MTLLLSGENSRQTTYKYTSKHWETALICDGYVEPTEGRTFQVTEVLNSLRLFDLRSENGHLLYQILFKCDLQGERSPEKDCRC